MKGGSDQPHTSPLNSGDSIQKRKSGKVREAVDTRAEDRQNEGAGKVSGDLQARDIDVSTDPYDTSRDIFLRCMCLIFLIAFASLYHQLPGLFGPRGLQPLKPFMKKMHCDRHSWFQPSVVCLYERLDMDVYDTADLACLLGMVASAAGVLGFACVPLVLFCTVLYLGLYRVGQTFLSFQWDILLVSLGLCALNSSRVMTFMV